MVALYYAFYHPLGSPAAALLSFDAYSFLTLVVVVAGVRVNRPANRWPWYFVIGALVAWQGTNASSSYHAVVLASPPGAADPVADLCTAVAYVALLAAAVALILQGSGGDGGGVLDAAVLSIAGGTLVWELAMYPELTALHAPGPQLALALVQLVCLMGVLGAVLRVAAVSAPSRPTLLYFVLAMLSGLVGNVGYLHTRHDVIYDYGTWTDATWLVGYAALGAAALHPASSRLGVARRRVVDSLHDTRLAALATALLTAPVVVGVSELLGHGSDTMLLAVASVSTVPLVMVRIRGLVQERQRAERALEHQATHDALTGLANRAALLTRLDAAHARVRAGDSPGLCLLFCDLNGFKGVNDTLGHAAGDELLVSVARRLRATVRAADVVARFGGDEFVVLCEPADPQLVAGELYPRMAAALEEPIPVDGVPVVVSASIGLAACGPDDDTEVAALLQAADSAMYVAKARARRDETGSVLHVAAPAAS